MYLHKNELEFMNFEAEPSSLEPSESMLEYLRIMGVRIEEGQAFLPTEEEVAGTSKGRASAIIEGALTLSAQLGLGDETAFFDLVFNPMWHGDNMSCDIQLQLLQEAENLNSLDGVPVDPIFKHRSVQVSTMLVSCQYAILSLKAQEGSSLAWEYACEASHWLGLAQGAASGEAMGIEIGKSKFAKTGANARHAEHRKFKAHVFEWCEANMSNFKSMDKAAEEVHRKVVPIGFRTARDWIGEWKKVRSAG